MSQPAKAPDPPIDEILASIRRSIVPDDDAGKPAVRKSRKPTPTPVAACEPDDTAAAPGEDDALPLQAQAAVLNGHNGATGPAADASLLSPRTTAAVDTAFHSLAHTVLSQNPRTLEDLVRDMLKPMLKEWLDANLPDMVERLVRAEIERVSRRG
jgi:cell pole-organizing protein PopZ